MILQVENLHKQYGGIHASRDINLAIKQHQIHAIIGPNGAGKTTLIAQLSGAVKSDSGRILFEDTDITHMPRHQRAHTGLVRSFQITSIILTMSVLENVMLAVQSISGHSFRFWKPVLQDAQLCEQAMQKLSEVGLAAPAQRLAGEISHGEQRQLEIAMALALKPKLLLLDEPMAGMSKEESSRMIELLNQLKGDTTILLIEHDMDAVFSLADTTSVLVNGHIIATGSTGQIRANSEVQKAYLGDT
ncbi:MAG: ABC transporter ATP-binding protein [Gammaproteobacteria bacterium]|nr:ABC transporter ATP-binding protein [Gammaproteobacteria bacterium]